MKFFKRILLVCSLSFFAFSTWHEYYISLTQIEFIKEKKSIQIISRVFINDFESSLSARYNKVLTFGGENETENLDAYIEQYLAEKLSFKINGKKVAFTYIGKQYDMDIVKCYLEIEDVRSIETFEVKNRILFDLIQEQQNIIKTKINSQPKSVILIPQKDTAVLKFN